MPVAEKEPRVVGAMRPNPQFESSLERRRRETKPEGLKGMPGRVPEERKAPAPSGHFLESYQEDWTDWPRHMAQSIADAYVNRFGGSNISRRQFTEDISKAEDVALSPAVHATKAYRAARGGRYGETAKQAALGALDVTPGKVIGAGAKSAGIFISPGFISKFPGMQARDAFRLVSEAEKLRNRGLSDRSILQRTRLAFLRDRGPDPAEVTPAYELPTRDLFYKKPQYQNMQDIEDVGHILTDPRARARSPKVGDIVNLNAYYRLFPEMKELPAVIDESLDAPLSLLWQGEPGYNTPGAMAFNPFKFGTKLGEERSVAPFSTESILTEERNPTLFNIGREFQLHAAQQSGFPGIVPRDPQMARDVGNMPPTFASASPDTTRILEALHDEVPVPLGQENMRRRAEALGTRAFHQTTGEALGRLGGYRLPMGETEMRSVTPDDIFNFANEPTMVNQLDPQTLYGYGKDWGGIFPDDRWKYWQDYVKYRLSPASWDTRTGQAYRRRE